MPLNSTGFERPRLNDLKTAYDANFTEAIGPVNTNADSVIGQIIGIFAAAMDDAYETLQDNYDSMYPYSAEGTSLDGAVALVGLERLGATATEVVGVAYGAESTLLPAGALVRAGSNQYALNADTVISRAACCDVEIEVTNLINSYSYQIVAGGVLASFTSDSTATASEIAAGLAAAFNPDNFTATSSGGVIKLTSADKTSDFPLTLDANLTITKLGSSATFTSLELGAIACPVGGLATIDTQVLGWDSVSNLVEGAIGRSVETDAALRLRHQDSVRAIGAATVKAIRARILQDVDSVTACSIYENRTNATVDNLPPHSFEAVVSGGLNSEILAKIWEVKPAGIETYGNVSGTVIDENGDGQTIKFSRPVPQYAWIRVSVNQLYSEETLTETVTQAIIDAVITYGSTLSVGDDIITQRFYGPIYSATTGLGQITVEAAITSTEGGTPSYSTNNISLARAEIATFSAIRVTVVGV